MRFSTSLTPVAALLALGLAAPAFGADTYTVGPQANGDIVVSNAQVLTPVGRVVELGAPVRAKAITLSPDGKTGAVLLMGANNPVEIFDLATGKVIQSFTPANGDTSGSYGGITYSHGGRYLYFSQDSSHFSDAKVAADGKLTGAHTVALPPSPVIKLYSSGTAYPGGIGISSDGTTAYVLLNQNNTVGVIDLTANPPVLKQQIQVGNAPNSIVVHGDYAYISNEGGRPLQPGDVHYDISSGTPIVTDPVTDTATTGTISVINTLTNKLVTNINLNAGTFAGKGLHPTGMAVWGSLLYVVNAYSETVEAIDLGTNKVVRSYDAGLPFGSKNLGAYGTMPTSVAVDGAHGVMYVTLATANAIAVIDLSTGARVGLIPTYYFPTTIAIDTQNNQLVVSNDKGIGTQADPGRGLVGTLQTSHGVTAFGTHQDVGVVNLIKIPTAAELRTLTLQVFKNNKWSVNPNIFVGPEFVNPKAKPVAIPAHIGEPSLIKHVFLIIKENRTYDQILGDVAKGKGDPSLAVFGPATPNQHALIKRWPLFDNAYAPSRQSADGHPWIVTGISAYADDIQSPDWVRSYPGGNSNDAMIYTPRGFLWSAALAKHLSVKLFGEWSLFQTIASTPTGGSYTWSDWYTAALIKEGNCYDCTTSITDATDTETAYFPYASSLLDPHYPSFNTGIPDQYRFDYWLPIFQNYEKTGTLPNLVIMWLPDDHTSGYSPGYPVPTAAQADNDLALGRIVEAISHSPDWKTSTIFVEEDDSQDGVDHIDGHRQPVYAIGPYVRQDGYVDNTIYTAANINRTIEQILGLTPMTQFDLVAEPMRVDFTNTPNLTPYTHVAATVPLALFPSQRSSAEQKTLESAWESTSGALWKQTKNKADVLEPNLLNHIIWYASTGWDRPYPGETKMKWPKDFDLKNAIGCFDADGDGDCN